MPVIQKRNGDSITIEGPYEEVNPYSLELRYGGRHEEAVEIFKKILSINSRSNEVWNRLCHIYIMQCDYDNAIKSSINALLNNPINEVVWYFLGLAYNLKGEKWNSLNAWKYINPPVHYETYYDEKLSVTKCQLAEAYFEKRNYKKALEICNEVIQTDSEHKYSWYLLSSIYKTENQYEKAIEICKRLIKIDPEYKYAWNMLSYLSIMTHNYDNAIAAAREAIKIDFDFKQAWVNLAGAYFEKGDHNKVINVCKRALENNKQNEYIWSNLARTYNTMGQYEMAINASNAALRINPEFSRALNHLGFAYFKKRDYSKAIELFKYAMELEPGYELARSNFEMVKKELNTEEIVDPSTRAVKRILIRRHNETQLRAKGYYLLAKYIYSIKDFDNSLKACNLCLSLNSHMKKALKLKIKIKKKL